MKTITPELSEILGLLCAEGCHTVSFCNYWEKHRNSKRFRENKKSERIEFYNKDEQLLNHYLKLLKTEFDYEPKITKHGKINICKKDIIEFIIGHTQLKSELWCIPQAVLDSPNSIKLAFLRGFFDGDGTTSNRVRMFSMNYLGLKQISKMLNYFKIKHTFQEQILKKNQKSFYIIQISQKDKERFLNLIEPVSKRPDLCGGYH